MDEKQDFKSVWHFSCGAEHSVCWAQCSSTRGRHAARRSGGEALCLELRVFHCLLGWEQCVRCSRGSPGSLGVRRDTSMWSWDRLDLS